jgi:hypothetical protein
MVTTSVQSAMLARFSIDNLAQLLSTFFRNLLAVTPYQDCLAFVQTVLQVAYFAEACIADLIPTSVSATWSILTRVDSP